MDYRFKLEKYSGKKSRFRCPKCQKQNQFTRYIDLETNEYLNEYVGVCNRVDKCGYHYTPSDFFKDNPENNKKTTFQPTISKTQKPPAPISLINQKAYEKSLIGYTDNNFFLFLKELFGQDIALSLITKYKIGTSKLWNGGSTIFWQIDSMNRVRTGKIMKYDRLTGKRIKEPFPHINWVHSLINKPEYNLKQCLFGEHLLKKYSNKPIAIVESEKTAVIASAYFPHFTWLASGSLQNLKPELLKPIRSKEIILFPDTSKNGTAFNKWNKVASELKQKFIHCTVSSFLEKNASEDEKLSGYDLADYLIKFPLSEFQPKTVRVVNQKEEKIKSMIDSNPSIDYLIEKFDLIK